MNVALKQRAMFDKMQENPKTIYDSGEQTKQNNNDSGEYDVLKFK